MRPSAIGFRLPVVALATAYLLCACSSAALPGTKRATILVAGDIAICSDIEGAQRTAELIEGVEGTVMTAGDNAYNDGTRQEFADCYDPTWGRFIDRTRPVPGNHDYGTPGAAGYFEYFGERAGSPGRGYYAFDAGDWRIYALDTNECVQAGCGPGTLQHDWLAEELENDPIRCTMAVGHHPQFTSGTHGELDDVRPLMELLYASGAELSISGHDHDYERLAPVRPDGRPDPENGIRQFVVGTGGISLREPGAVPAPHSEVFDNSTHGVLALDLRPDGYDWEFLPVEGGTFTDSGSGSCHGPPS